MTETVEIGQDAGHLTRGKSWWNHLPYRLAACRFMPLETYPTLVAVVQRPLGKAGLLVVAASLLVQLSSLGLPITIAAAACAFAGRYRSRVLPIATLGVLLAQPGWFAWTTPAIVARRDGGLGAVDTFSLRWNMLVVVLSLSAAAIHCARRYPGALFARRPVLSLVGVSLVLLLLGASGMVRGSPEIFLWAFLTPWFAYLWFLAYALADQRVKAADPTAVQMGTFHPFWGSSTIPYGKGAAYLRKVEATTPQDLAVVQLKGVKLLAWVALLSVLWEPIRGLAVEMCRIPTLDAALERQVAGQPYPWYVCWASTVFGFFSYMLWLVVSGGTFVAAARLGGYRLLRNTYRPLSSTTLAEFFNRYYYYYKELLVEFFFFPTFLRCFKRQRQLRVLTATFMAAGVGNFLWHFLRDFRYVADLGLRRTLVGFLPFAFYCAVLGLALGLSQLRSHRRKARTGWLRGQLIPSLFVLLFYCLLQVFMNTYSPYSLGQHFAFVLRLLGSDAWM
ncbi:MAG: hypothetical protein ABI766_10620 [Gemmatimonadales bacterium]